MCDWDLMAVWMSFINPTKFSLGMSVAQPPQKREERKFASGIFPWTGAKMSGTLLIWSADILMSRRSPQIPAKFQNCMLWNELESRLCICMIFFTSWKLEGRNVLLIFGTLGDCGDNRNVVELTEAPQIEVKVSYAQQWELTKEVIRLDLLCCV